MKKLFGISFIEYLLVLGIVVMIAGLAIRVIYGTKIREWEDTRILSIGFNPEVVHLVFASCVLIFLLIYGIWKRTRNRNRRQFTKPRSWFD